MAPDAQGRERYLGEDGYVHVKVGPEHPMAHINGWAREHRIVMAEHLGRVLDPEELVHHDDEDKTHNVIQNLVLKGRASHAAEHKPRLGTGRPTCRNGHPWKVSASGRRRCNVCEYQASKESK